MTETPPARGAALQELVAVMDRLRSPGGCPWDARQTHESLVEYLVEETYETIEAIDSKNRAELREELGDLLLQVVFHSRIAQEDPVMSWDIDDVARGITQKLIARHPHVFADGTAETAEDVEAQWQARKAAEKGRSSVLDGLPIAMPPITHASKVIRRARHGGIEVEPPESARMAARSAMAELSPDSQRRSAEFGELLLALITAAEHEGIDADESLRSAVLSLRDRIRSRESGTAD